MQCIKIYEDFSYLYSSLVKELHIFDLNGNFRDRNVAEENMEILLGLLDTLGRTTLSDTVDKIRKTLPELLNYFDKAASIIDNLRQSDIDENALKALWRVGNGIEGW